MADKIDLRNRNHLTNEEAVSLVDQFAALHPDLYEAWLDAEVREIGITHLGQEINELMFSQCLYESATDVFLSVVDLRGEVLRRARSALEAKRG